MSKKTINIRAVRDALIQYLHDTDPVAFKAQWFRMNHSMVSHFHAGMLSKVPESDIWESANGDLYIRNR